MNYCVYKSLHGNYPSDCKECDNCAYYYHEPYGDIIKEWREKAGVTIPVLYRYSSFEEKLIICTSRPGPMIGKAGCLIEEYKQKLIDAHMKIKEVQFIECANEAC